MRFLFIIFLVSSMLWAKEKDEDGQTDNLIMFSIYHTFQIPGGDLKKRFGNNSNIGCLLAYKTNKNIIFSLGGGGLFGSNVKESNLFNNIDGNNGYLISQIGELPTIRLFERGGYIDISVGKYFLLPIEKSESGILISIGTGYLYHKIFIETLVTALPQLSDDLLKGYDRLSGGLFTKQSIEYLHFGKKNNIRYSLGVECIEGFTKDLRGYNYTLQEHTVNTRIDYLFGIKCGIIIPLQERTTERYYYY